MIGSIRWEWRRAAFAAPRPDARKFGAGRRQPDFPGAARLIAERPFACDQNQQVRAVVGVVSLARDIQLLRAEIRAIHEQLAGCRLGSRMPASVRHLHAFIQMQFARPAVVIEAVGHVGVLLDLAEHDAGADGVHRMRRSEVRLAGLHRNPVHELLDLAGARRPPQPLARDRLAEPQRDLGARLGVAGCATSRSCRASPSSPSSGCTWTERRSEVKINFTSSGNSRPAQIPCLADRLLRIAETTARGAFAPQTFSRRRRRAGGRPPAHYEFLTMNWWMRSSPRSSSVIDVA